MFGENGNHHVAPGDFVLLQQLKTEVEDSHSRITHLLEVESYGPDSKNLSEAAWGVSYRNLMHGVIHELAQPFSLEDLGLSRSYSKPGAQSPEQIEEIDKSLVLEAIGDLR
jgi:hypothetical protein